jgi:hypothetical protein
MGKGYFVFSSYSLTVLSGRGAILPSGMSHLLPPILTKRVVGKYGNIALSLVEEESDVTPAPADCHAVP